MPVRVRKLNARRSPLHGGVDRNRYRNMPSHLPRVAPSRGRGSKRDPAGKIIQRPGSRPFTGAWIETRLSIGFQICPPIGVQN